MNDCISAVATAPGTGGVAIIRISGKNSLLLALIMILAKIKPGMMFLFIWQKTILKPNILISIQTTKLVFQK